MRGQGLNDLPRCELEPRSSHHKGIFFEVPYIGIPLSIMASMVALVAGHLKNRRLEEDQRRTLIPDPLATEQATKTALEVGFRHFDCPERYRNEQLGTAWNGPRFFGLRIDKGTTVSPDAAGVPLGPLDGRHLARDSGAKPPQAAVTQGPSDNAAVDQRVTPLSWGIP